MSRFVLLYHQMPAGSARASHWDFMWEDGDRLRTWALDQLPLPDQSVTASVLPDHRLFYLDFQGPLSGNRGIVTRIDQGECLFEAEKSSPNCLQFRILGVRYRGHFIIRTWPIDDACRVTLVYSNQECDSAFGDPIPAC